MTLSHFVLSVEGIIKLGKVEGKTSESHRINIRFPKLSNFLVVLFFNVSFQITPFGLGVEPPKDGGTSSGPRDESRGVREVGADAARNLQRGGCHFLEGSN